MDAIGTIKPSLQLTTLTLPDTFIFNFLIISFIFIENKCLSDAIWDLKREKKSFSHSKKHTPYHLHHWNWYWINVFF